MNRHSTEMQIVFKHMGNASGNHEIIWLPIRFKDEKGEDARKESMLVALFPKLYGRVRSQNVHRGASVMICQNVNSPPLLT